MPVVKVSKRGRERILKGHLWVYRSDVRAVSAVSSGEVVDVQNPQGGFLGRAFYSDSSQIALRLITTKDEVVDEDFWRRKLVEALARRGNLLPATTAYRWVHGEADGIPSLVVDRYGDYLSIQTLTAGTDRLKECFIRLCVELAEPVGIMERSDQKARVLEGLPLIKDVVFGEIPPSVSVHEAGIELRVDLREGQKTGLFLDQRENRVAAGSHAAGKALDVFCYDGGFSLHLAGGVPERVGGGYVDRSAGAAASQRRGKRVREHRARPGEWIRRLAGARNARGAFRYHRARPAGFRQESRRGGPGSPRLQRHQPACYEAVTSGRHSSDVDLLLPHLGAYFPRHSERSGGRCAFPHGSAGQASSVPRSPYPAGDARDALSEVCDLAQIVGYNVLVSPYHLQELLA